LLIYKEIQSRAVAKSYMRKGFLIYEEMRKYFPIYEEAVIYDFATAPFLISLYVFEKNLIFFLFQCSTVTAVKQVSAANNKKTKLVFKTVQNRSTMYEDILLMEKVRLQ
jgi:hypothetical protein